MMNKFMVQSIFNNTIKVPKDVSTFKLQGNLHLGGMLPNLVVDGESIEYITNLPFYKEISDVKNLANGYTTVNKILDDISQYTRKSILGTQKAQLAMEDLKSPEHKLHDQYVVDVLNEKIRASNSQDAVLKLNTQGSWNVLDDDSKKIMKKYANIELTLKDILLQKGVTGSDGEKLGIKGDCRYTSLMFYALASTWQKQMVSELENYITVNSSEKTPALGRWKQKLDEVKKLDINFANYELYGHSVHDKITILTQRLNSVQKISQLKRHPLHAKALQEALKIQNEITKLLGAKDKMREQHCMPIIAGLPNAKDGTARVFDPFYTPLNKQKVTHAPNAGNLNPDRAAPQNTHLNVLKVEKGGFDKSTYHRGGKDTKKDVINVAREGTRNDGVYQPL